MILAKYRNGCVEQINFTIIMNVYREWILNVGLRPNGGDKEADQNVACGSTTFPTTLNIVQ